MLLTPWLAVAQRKTDNRPPPLSPAESVRAGRELVTELLTQKPDSNTTNSGVLRIRDARDHERSIPIKFAIYSTPTNWVSTYEALPSEGDAGGEQLTIIHNGERPSVYLLRRPATPGGTNAPIKLTRAQTFTPFAGSDFWIADLGLEFLHWPKQRVIRKEMRRGQPCSVLESDIPQPDSAGYSRVISWVDNDNGGILHADAYDAQGTVFKRFDPTGVTGKINGRRQLEGIEMRNVKTDSHTWIKFDVAQSALKQKSPQKTQNNAELTVNAGVSIADSQ